MVTHRIRELREARGWSQEQLALRIGRTKSVISRIEDGKTRLDLEIARKIAEELDEPLAKVLGIDMESGPLLAFSEELIPYKANHDDKLLVRVDDGEYPFTVETDALNKAGIQRGDVVVVSDAPEKCRAPKPLQPVRVRLHPPDDFMKPVTLLMLFVPPSLLITNSSAGNRMLDMDRDDAHIVGTVERVYRRYG
jgi:transcriptional regulator with XRE-family HTH domain